MFTVLLAVIDAFSAETFEGAYIGTFFVDLVAINALYEIVMKNRKEKD